MYCISVRPPPPPFQGQVTNNPQVLSSPSAGDKMALALDSCLHVINNDFSCCPSGGAAVDAEDSSPDEAAISTAVAVSLRFPSQIDCLSWTPCCNFVLLGLGSGEAQLLHVPTKTPLPPIALLDRDRQIGRNSGFKAFAGCWTEKAKAGPLSTLCLASTDFKVRCRREYQRLEDRERMDVDLFCSRFFASKM